MSLYRQASIANEVMEEMAKVMKLSHLEDKYAFNKLSSAIDHLASAADIFDATGYSGEAEVLTRMISRLAEKHEEMSKEAAFEDFTLSPEDRKFFDQLEKHHKDRLGKLSPRDLAEEVRKMHMEHQKEEEIKARNDSMPEVIEFESLLRGKDLPQTERLDEIIEGASTTVAEAIKKMSSARSEDNASATASEDDMIVEAALAGVGKKKAS
jgi:hypothetical protein